MIIGANWKNIYPWALGGKGTSPNFESLKRTEKQKREKNYHTPPSSGPQNSDPVICLTARVVFILAYPYPSSMTKFLSAAP